MTKLTIILTEREFERLHQTAQRDLRHPRDQARFIIRSVLLGESPPQHSQQLTKNTSGHGLSATAGVCE